MKRSIQIVVLFSIVALGSTAAWGQFGSFGPLGGTPVAGLWYNDADGDGLCDYCGAECLNDADGDGLCDYCGAECLNDADGDGLCDLCGAPNGAGPNGYGPGDGTGDRVQPRDGSGYGPGTTSGTGDCDGTGPTRDRLHRGSRSGARR